MPRRQPPKTITVTSPEQLAEMIYRGWYEAAQGFGGVLPTWEHLGRRGISSKELWINAARNILGKLDGL